MIQLLAELASTSGTRYLLLGPVDVGAARRVLEQAAVQQRVPRPRLGEWWSDVLTRIAEVLAGLFDLSSATVRSLLTLASWGLIALAALVLLGWAVSVVLGRRSSSLDSSGSGVTTVVDLEEDRTVDWERRLREALERHDVSAALRAQWQVLFRRLEADASSTTGSGAWTTRAMLRRIGSNSPSLSSALARLERWTYGGRRPDIDDLRRLHTDLDAALGPAGGRS